MNRRTQLKPSLPASARDANLAFKIRSALAACGRPELSRLDVSALEGEVTLRGRVGTYYQKQLAQSAVMQLDGVEFLQNEIVVN